MKEFGELGHPILFGKRRISVAHLGAVCVGAGNRELDNGTREFENVISSWMGDAGRKRSTEIVTSRWQDVWQNALVC